MQENSQEVTHLREQLTDAHDATMRLRDAWISGRDMQIRMESEVKSLHQEMAVCKEELKELQNEIEQMRATKIWQLGTLYWRVHAWAIARLKRAE